MGYVGHLQSLYLCQALAQVAELHTPLSSLITDVYCNNAVRIQSQALP